MKKLLISAALMASSACAASSDPLWWAVGDSIDREARTFSNAVEVVNSFSEGKSFRTVYVSDGRNIQSCVDGVTTSVVNGQAVMMDTVCDVNGAISSPATDKGRVFVANEFSKKNIVEIDGVKYQTSGFAAAWDNQKTLPI